MLPFLVLPFLAYLQLFAICRFVFPIFFINDLFFLFVFHVFKFAHKSTFLCGKSLIECKTMHAKTSILDQLSPPT